MHVCTLHVELCEGRCVVLDLCARHPNDVDEDAQKQQQALVVRHAQEQDDTSAPYYAIYEYYTHLLRSAARRLIAA